MNIETDSMAPDSADPEDQAILEALDAFAMGEGSAEGSADEALRRLYVEVLGLLPASLDREVPEDRVWQRLAADLGFPAMAGDSPAVVAESASLPAAEAPLAPMAPMAPVASVAPIAPAAPMAPVAPMAAMPSASPIEFPPVDRSATVPFAPTGSRTAMRRQSRWPLALAATLAFALAGLSLYLLRNLNEQSDQVAALYVKLAAAERQTADAQQAKKKLEDMEGKYSLVTDPGVSINRLAPAAELVQPDARGILFVASDHSHWVLSLSNLHPTETGKGYQLWFMGESAAVSGGTFTARPGEVVKLSAESMPAGTKAILITLEPAAGSPLPSGPKVLTTVG
ncbi:MAG: anti-sigma factor [Acidobacteriota bacterium]